LDVIVKLSFSKCSHLIEWICWNSKTHPLLHRSNRWALCC